MNETKTYKINVIPLSVFKLLGICLQLLDEDEKELARIISIAVSLWVEMKLGALHRLMEKAEEIRDTV